MLYPQSGGQRARLVCLPLDSISYSLLTILNVCHSFLFLSLPFAVSVATTVQISKQLAKKRPRRARTVAYLCLFEGTLLMAVAAGGLYLLRDHFGYVFTSNEDIVYRLKKMAPFTAGFQVLYGVYGAAQGVMRATSRQFEIFG
jgi:MATE family multidrug resistance protein